MGTRFGTFEDLLNETLDARRPVADRLREVILVLHPDAVAAARLGDRAATYGFGPRKMSEGYAYIMLQQN